MTVDGQAVEAVSAFFAMKTAPMKMNTTFITAEGQASEYALEAAIMMQLMTDVPWNR